MTTHAALLRGDTRLQAYKAIKPHLQRLQEIVLTHIEVCGPQTAEEIAAGLELSGDTVRPRIVELCREGLIRAEGERLTKAGRFAQLWRVTGEPRS